MKSFAIKRLVVFGWALSWAAGSAVGATAVLRAVRINDTPIAPTGHVTIRPGDLVVAEAYISGWNENEPGGRLRTFQLSIDALGSYWSGESGSLVLAGLDLPGGVVPCMSDADCALEAALCSRRIGCLLGCASDADCDEQFPRCSVFGLMCVGEDHDPDAFSFVDESHPNFVFAGQAAACAVRSLPLDPAGGCAVFEDGVLDDGNERYAVTFAFEASDDACGRFTVRFEDVPKGSSGPERSFVGLASGYAYGFDSLIPLHVNVFCPLPIGACCLPRNLCEDLPRGGCDRKGGAWQPDYACGDEDLTCPRFIIGPRGWESR